jgi:hypothetical protein
MRSVLAMLFVASSAAAAPPGATPPVVRAPAMTVPQAPPPEPPAPALTAIDPDAVPQPCLDLALRAGSTNAALAQSSRVSLALCIANQTSKSVAVCDCEQTVKDFDEAIAPAFAILDELAAIGEPTWQVIALHAEADVLAGMVRRVEATLPAATSPEQQELRELRVQMLRPLLEPWRTRSQNAFVQVDRVAKVHPEVGKNQLAASAVADSRRRLAPAVATP